MPDYILLLGGLKNDKNYLGLVTKASKEDLEKIYRVLCARFWCHAHLFGAVITLLFLTMSPNDGNADVLFKVAIASFSFALCETIGGALADKYGCKCIIIWGLRIMSFLMLLFGLFTALNNFFKDFSSIIIIIGQVILGISLALINGADTQITKSMSEDIINFNEKDEDLLEGICTKLKYSGIALATFFGCLLYVIFEVTTNDSIQLFGKSLIFFLTGIFQYFAIKCFSHVEESKKDTQTPVLINMRNGFSTILNNKALAMWVLLIASIEGWLLFSKYYFELNALIELVDEAKNNYFLIPVIPILYWLLSKLASYGGSYFNICREDIGKDNKSILDIPRSRLIIAGMLLLIIMATFILHLVISMSFGWFSLGSLCFYAFFQFLRGFSQPLLRTTITNLTKETSNRTTILSLATGSARLFHLFSCALYLFSLSQVNAFGIAGDDKGQALAATIVIIALTILVFNVFTSVLLNRELKEEEKKLSFKINYNSRSLLIKGFFFTSLVLSNLLAVKMCSLGALVFNAGALPYALTYLFTDIISEVEGKRASYNLWLSGVFTYFVVIGIVGLAVILPEHGGQDSGTSKAFLFVFSNVFQFVLASFCSFFVAQYIDIRLFSSLKKITGERALWLRNNISTFFSQTVDTVIFISIAFYYESWKHIIALIIGQLLVKWIIAFLDTPLLYLGVKFLRGDKK